MGQGGRGEHPAPRPRRGLAVRPQQQEDRRRQAPAQSQPNKSRNAPSSKYHAALLFPCYSAPSSPSSRRWYLALQAWHLDEGICVVMEASGGPAEGD